MDHKGAATFNGVPGVPIVLSASALEKHLKRAAGVDRFDHYSDLVADAAARLGMNMAWREQAEYVFRLRNRVVHDDYPATQDEEKEIHDKAGEVLSNARDLLTSLV